MNEEDILNALEDINSILDGFIERVNTLEFNRPQKPEYYKQFLKSIRKVDRCIGGVVLPVEGECDCSTTPNPEVPIISCDGATNNIFIDMFSFLDSSDEITVRVNERVETFINKQDFDNRFNDVFAPPSLEISDVYHFYAGAGINYRMSITVSSSDFDTPVQIDDGEEFNPTFMFEGKTISCCFAMGE